MSEQKQKKSGLVKTLIFTSALIGGVILGEQIKPIQTTKDFITYYNVGPEDGTPKDYKNYQAQIRINKHGRAELYFGNKKTQEYRKVNEDGTVGTLGQKIDEYIQERKNQFNEWYVGLKKKINH